MRDSRLHSADALKACSAQRLELTHPESGIRGAKIVNLCKRRYDKAYRQADQSADSLGNQLKSVTWQVPANGQELVVQDLLEGPSALYG